MQVALPPIATAQRIHAGAPSIQGDISDSAIDPLTTANTISASRRVGPALFLAEVSASSKRYDDAANTRVMAGYAVVNLYAEWAAGRGVTLFVRGDNVLGRDYELAADYATGGAQVFGGVRWAM